MWCVLKDYDGDVSFSQLFDDYASAVSYASHLRSILNFRWRVWVAVVSFYSYEEIVNKVVNGKRAAHSERKAR